jgi:hypothetical protein|tara:strand:+ start:1946 stop:2581 length:636 start_codon:yes stop_codon:yes gene_type:complete
VKLITEIKLMGTSFIGGVIITLLMSLSFILGLFIGSEDWVSVVGAAGTTVAAIATVMTAYIAYAALSGWKKKSDYDLVIEEYEKVKKQLMSLRVSNNKLVRYLGAQHGYADAYDNQDDTLISIVMELSLSESKIHDSIKMMIHTLMLNRVELPSLIEVQSYFEEHGKGSFFRYKVNLDNPDLYQDTVRDSSLSANIHKFSELKKDIITKFR